jgi:hypothetical protein
VDAEEHGNDGPSTINFQLSAVCDASHNSASSSLFIARTPPPNFSFLFALSLGDEELGGGAEEITALAHSLDHVRDFDCGCHLESRQPRGQ